MIIIISHKKKTLDEISQLCYNFSLRGYVLRIFLCPNGGNPVLRELMCQDKVVGVKQSRRAIREGRAERVFLASNADPALVSPIEQLCREREIRVDADFSMEELGRAAGIQVGAAVVALLRQGARPEIQKN